MYLTDPCRLQGRLPRSTPVRRLKKINTLLTVAMVSVSPPPCPGEGYREEHCNHANSFSYNTHRKYNCNTCTVHLHIENIIVIRVWYALHRKYNYNTCTVRLHIENIIIIRVWYALHRKYNCNTCKVRLHIENIIIIRVWYALHRKYNCNTCKVRLHIENIIIIRVQYAFISC